MSHGAVVAREYGQPAIVGVNGVTEFVKSGDIVTLDGNKGILHKAPTQETPEVIEASEEQLASPHEDQQEGSAQAGLNHAREVKPLENSVSGDSAQPIEAKTPSDPKEKVSTTINEREDSVTLIRCEA